MMKTMIRIITNNANQLIPPFLCSLSLQLSLRVREFLLVLRPPPDNRRRDKCNLV
jgi:hypothetical protein